MAYTTINKSTTYFNTKLYTATGNDNLAITGVGFQPDLTWIKERSSTSSHALWDVVRGVTKKVESDNDQAEGTDATGLKSFDSDGFTLGTSAQVNHSGVTNVAWNWKAGGAGSANSDGATASTVSANTTAGFSIVKWTGTGSATTVGHGLGVAPTWIMVKNLADANDWFVYTKAIGYTMTSPDPETDYLKLNQINGRQDEINAWNDTAPTSTVFTVGSASNVNGSSDPMIAYCYTDKTGYCKIGTYLGNGSADGAFVYTGFKPEFVIVKVTSTDNNWNMFDSKRPGYNEIDQRLFPNLSNAEQDGTCALDFLSNGFKTRNNNDNYNGSGVTYVYMAFGQTIVGSNNIPATAR